MSEVLYPAAVGPRSTQQAPVFELFGVNVDNVSLADAVDWVSARRPGRSCRVGLFANAHSFTTAWRDARLREDLNAADRVFADGVGVRLAARRNGVILRDNVNGTDLFPLVAAQLAGRGRSVFLLGAKPGVADEAAARLLSRYPGLRIAGTQHGYFSREDSGRIIDRINASGADVLLVALGSPRQERWLISHRYLLTADCALAVGGLFDFLSQRIPRAPRWMRRLELEWVYRLIQEPGAKWRRYILGNAQFLYRTYLAGGVS